MALERANHGSATSIWVACARIAAAFAAAKAAPSISVVTTASSTTPGMSSTVPALAKGVLSSASPSRAKAASATGRGTRFQ